MKKFTPALAILAMTASPLVLAEAMTKSGNLGGVIPMPVTAVAAINANINYYPHSAGEKDHKDKAPPYPYTGKWTFTWGDAADSVDFAGVITLGDYFTVTDAGTMGGVTKQTFYGFSHNVKGTAKWDAGSRTLTYDMEPKDRDDSRASTVTQKKDADCDKIKGFTAGKACSAFEETSPPLEGLKLKLVFSEDMSSVKGDVTMIQYGGSGMTESRTDVPSTVSGTLN